MKYLMIGGGILLVCLGVFFAWLWAQTKSAFAGIMIMLVPAGAYLIWQGMKQQSGASVKEYVKKKKEGVEDKDIPLLVWKALAEGGISDQHKGTDELDKDKTLAVWKICGSEYRFAEAKAGTSILPPPVDQAPEKLARLMGCRPRQRLNASDKDWLQKLAPWAPVVVIIVALLYIFITISAPPPA
jgi:hypothetical protein